MRRKKRDDATTVLKSGIYNYKDLNRMLAHFTENPR